jgi:hypothetical protein
MVDFERLRRESYERATPEERARIDAYHAREARLDETKGYIKAVFEREKRVPDGIQLGLLNRRSSRYGSPRHDPKAKMKTIVEKTWEKMLPVRIEDRDNGDGTTREIISFKEAVTGYESYTIDEDFIRLLLDPEENRQRPRFYICAGTPGRYDACYVMPEDVVAYLRERRPHLFPEYVPPRSP